MFNGIGVEMWVEPLHRANGSMRYTQSFMFFLLLHIVSLETSLGLLELRLLTHLFQDNAGVFGLSEEGELSSKIETDVP